ncbi:MAG: TIGR00730 family Rossman fold protein [Ilumatobacteraceae bacterium]
MATICVYCGSSSGRRPAYRDAAGAVGTAIAADGHELVYGGGHVGLMGVVADAVLAGGGIVTGVMTEHLVEREVAHGGLTELEVVPSMHERKARMVARADGVVVLPGGFGTLDETFEVLTWNQLGLTSSNVVFLDVEGYFAPLFEFVGGAVEAGFVSEVHGGLVRRAEDGADAVRLAGAPPPPLSDKWLD